MSLTLLYRSKKSRYVYRPTKRQILTCFIVICGLFLISSRSTDSPDENLARLALAQSGLHQQQAQIDDLKNTTEQRLAIVLQKLAEAQSRLVKVNALGARLVEQAQLNPEEFSFSVIDEEAAALPETSTDLGQYNVVSRIEIMLDELENKEQQLGALESILMSHHITEESALAGRPIEAGWLSSYYGIRTDPFTGKPTMHKGLDFAGAEGEPVLATGAGIVTWAASRYGYGNLVEIDHGNGLVTRFGHNKTLNVKMGDVVTKGQSIALMGNTGRSTGPHVHYEVINKGQPQDPLPFVYRD
ncbi:M23 family metallopeptidase [Paraglaciecola sp. L1A13]|uniref:M23 family metallopeptidase n=1 Tax=Paraglaciecola sp. L1A13 TaxID=2686359 RepID=UPI00131CBC44|nr:M23 family metallopeptidase [Paraglaciecola sp. L1A13]